MPSMPGLVTKTKTFRAMDTIWSPDPETRMSEYDGAGSVDALLKDAVAKGWITKAVAKHVTNHWLKAYWPTAKAQQVLQRGLFWAMRVAAFENAGEATQRRRAESLPICCAWVCSGPAPDSKQQARIEVVTLESAQQVTLLFLTPAPKGIQLPTQSDGLQPVWSTRRKEFPPAAEKQLEAWKDTITVRPWEREDYPAR